MDAGHALQVRRWLEAAADVDAAIADDLLARLRDGALRPTAHGGAIGFARGVTGGERRVVEVDRGGTVTAVLRWTEAGSLTRAWLRVPDGAWVAVEPRAVTEAPWGCSDRLWRSGRLVADGDAPGTPLTTLQAVDWACPGGIPTAAEPARIPPGAGARVLNLLAALAADQGRLHLAYRGPYPTEQLFLTLLESFRYLGQPEDALAAFMAGDLEWAPAPFEPVFLGDVYVQARGRIEKVCWRGRTYHRPGWQGVRRHAARRIEDVPGGARCVLTALGATLETHLAIGHDVERLEVLAPPAAGGAPAAMPPEVGAGVVAMTIAASAAALAGAIEEIGRDLAFEWGPIEADLVEVRAPTVRVSTRLAAALAERLGSAASREARLAIALLALEELAHLVGDALRGHAQARLLGLGAEAQAAALASPTGDEAAARGRAIARAVARAAGALAGGQDECTITQTLKATNPTTEIDDSAT